jgi:predicted molibdopterin-dependent oxidoreductase YjgC
LPSPLWDRATWRLPSAGFAEKAGGYVNHAGRLQSAQWAIRPPQGARAEGDILWRLLEMEGLYNARRVLEEIAATVPYFAAAAAPVPDVGVQLENS